jgi:glycine/D-amino acid oxidase-like deaminating enzyme/nitrite reductase/ring-hydroxylating ferredoxin subunit
MEGQSGMTKSYWMASASVPKFERLSGNVEGIDVCVIGAGISGLTTAYLLAQQGKSVVVLDDGPIASGETQRTTAHITNVIDDRYFELVRMHGKEKARLAADSQTAAIEKIQSIVEAENIECDFIRVDGYLFQGENDKLETLEKELKTVRELGFRDVEMVNKLPFGLAVNALRFQHQAQFHVLKYIKGLCRAITKLGGWIYNFEHVSQIEDGELVTVRTESGHTIKARNLVVATNSPVSDKVKIHTKQAAYRTYVIGAKVTAGSVQTALYWDTENPYHYIRLQPTDSPLHDILILGGEDHRTGEKDDGAERFLRLERWLHMHIPQAETVEYRWSGQVYEPADGLSFIGRDPAHGENVFIATGDSGMGMTNGTVSGILLTDLICGKPNPWADLYDPKRKPFGAPIEYLKENLNTAGQYVKKVMPAEAKSANDLKRGEAAIIRNGSKQIAAYKDEDGNLHQVSATCTHLGATVCWNSCEKSWDCPAHGSRYDTDGQVIDGPANSNLAPADQAEHKHKESA